MEASTSHNPMGLHGHLQGPIMFPNSGSSNIYSVHCNHRFLCGFLVYEMMQSGSILEEYRVFSPYSEKFVLQLEKY
jgi:hypothetical protein